MCQNTIKHCFCACTTTCMHVLTFNLVHLCTISEVLFNFEECAQTLEFYCNMRQLVIHASCESSIKYEFTIAAIVYFLRAGRCSPGICFHLFSRVRYDSLLEYQIPELLRTPLQVKMFKNNLDMTCNATINLNGCPLLPRETCGS